MLKLHFFIFIIVATSFVMMPDLFGAPLPLSIHDAVEMALQHNNNLLLAKERLAGSEATLESEKAQFRPKHFLETQKSAASNTSANTQSRTDLSAIRYGMKEEYLLPARYGAKANFQIDWGIEEQETNNPGTTSYQVVPKGAIDFKQPLTKAGRITESSPPVQANLVFQQAKYQYQQGAEQIIFEILSSYIEGLKATRSVEATQETLKQTKQQVEITEVQVKLGVMAGIELLKLKVQLALDNNAVVESYKREKAIREKIRNQLGLPEGTEITLTTIPPFNKMAINTEELTKLAKSHRADIRVSDIQQKLIELSVQAAKSLNDPVLNLSGSYQLQEVKDQFSEAVGSPLGGDKKNWAVSAIFSFPLSDGGSEQAATQRALSEQRSIRLGRRVLEQSITEEINNVISAVLTSEQLYDTMAENLKMAEEALKTDQTRFSSGQITTTDFLRSQFALFQIKAAQNNALLDHFISQIGLLKATGTLTLDGADRLVQSYGTE